MAQLALTEDREGKIEPETKNLLKQTQ